MFKNMISQVFTLLLVLGAVFGTTEGAKLLGQGCKLSNSTQCGANARCTPVQRCSNVTGIGVCWCNPGFVQPMSLWQYQRAALMRQMGDAFWEDCLPILKVGDSCSVRNQTLLYPENAGCSKNTSRVECVYGFKLDNGNCTRINATKGTLGDSCTLDIQCDEARELKCLPGRNNSISPLRCGCVSGFWRDGKCTQSKIGDNCTKDSDCNLQKYEHGYSMPRCMKDRQRNESVCTCGSPTTFSQVPYIFPTTRIHVNVTSSADDHVWTRTVRVPMRLNLDNSENVRIRNWCIDIGYDDFDTKAVKLGQACTLDLPRAAPGLPINKRVKVCGQNMICHYCPTSEDYADEFGRCIAYDWSLKSPDSFSF